MSADEDTEFLGIKLLLDKVVQPDPYLWIIMGDFNSHSPSWGYDDLGHKGDEVEDRIITHNMLSKIQT